MNEMNKETTDITLDVEKWESYNMSRDYDNLGYGDRIIHSFLPVGVFNYLQPAFYGYMLAPCATYKGHTLISSTEHVNDLEEFRQKIVDSDQLAFLHRIAYVPSQPIFFIHDDLRGHTEYKDPPEIYEGGWLIKYAMLEAKVQENSDYEKRLALIEEKIDGILDKIEKFSAV